ncbi:hypothetical protein F7725_003787 [Dissostichus mawsoni]|uniref:Choline/carnitine acyltransferase domain-containing protein n=1 Tax=Dissostichus mawsoni TaxID=36200 RepID=A0A7J5YD53_DISMA|nr:hypothetical protein F7725_003787 [Dissostichus mawsoni]
MGRYQDVSRIRRPGPTSPLHISRMTLLNYPVPELDVTLQEVSRVLQLTLRPDLYPEFKNTLEQQRALLQQAQEQVATRALGKENWVTEQFKRSLLSCYDPLPTSTALPVVLLPPKAKGCTQLGRAAALLWAAAKLYSEPKLLEGNECSLWTYWGIPALVGQFLLDRLLTSTTSWLR